MPDRLQIWREMAIKRVEERGNLRRQCACLLQKRSLRRLVHYPLERELSEQIVCLFTANGSLPLCFLSHSILLDLVRRPYYHRYSEQQASLTISARTALIRLS